MAEIGFYHLTRTGLAEALARLLDRTLQAGRRALVLCPDPARLKELDAALWACAEPVWLPQRASHRIGELSRLTSRSSAQNSR